MGYPTKITDACDIVSAYYAIKYPSKNSFGATYLESHIFDEEKSVRWNREEVQRRNTEVLEKFRAARDEYDRQIKGFWADVDAYIANEFNISFEAANVFRQTMWNSDSIGYEIEEFQTFLEDFYMCYQVLEEAKKK